MKAFIIIIMVGVALLLAGCAGLPDIPPGEYDVYPVGRTLAPGQAGCWYYGSPGGQYAACLHDQPLPTPTMEATPTIEVQPSPTVAPTVTPEPTCYVYNGLAVSIRIRADHNATATVVGALPAGQRVGVTSLYRNNTLDETWAHVPTGWVAVWYGGATIASLQGQCTTIPTEVARAGPAVGWHATFRTDNADLKQSLEILKAAGVQPAAKVVNLTETQKAAEAVGAITAFRSTIRGDCADMRQGATYAAHLRYGLLAPYVLYQDIHPTFVEPDNECGYSHNPAWLNEYGVELYRLFDEQGARLVFPTEGPGFWEREQIQAIGPLLDAILWYDGCFGFHAYGVTPYVRVADSGDWLGYRFRLIRQWMVALDPAYAAIPFCITEVGTGSGDQPFNLSDFLDYNRSLKDTDNILFTAWWTAGEWASGASNTNGQMAPAARSAPGASGRRKSDIGTLRRGS
ncbi:MAG: hypothetical protein JW910_09390 [Anaerolineae bacterium]|nr:hypothetical protein [Anaerolineae bacterium]